MTSSCGHLKQWILKSKAQGECMIDWGMEEKQVAIWRQHFKMSTASVCSQQWELPNSKFAATSWRRMKMLQEQLMHQAHYIRYNSFTPATTLERDWMQDQPAIHTTVKLQTTSSHQNKAPSTSDWISLQDFTQQFSLGWKFGQYHCHSQGMETCLSFKLMIPWMSCARRCSGTCTCSHSIPNDTGQKSEGDIENQTEAC